MKSALSPQKNIQKKTVVAKTGNTSKESETVY